MITLQITGLKPEVKVVSLMSAVGKYSTGSLAKGKALIEEVIGGKTVTLSFQNEEQRGEFHALADSLGAIIR